jgi:hypothetical protein
MRNVIRHWTIRAGARLPEMTAVLFLLLGLGLAGWIVAGDSRNFSADGKGAAVQPVDGSGKTGKGTLQLTRMR